MGNYGNMMIYYGDKWCFGLPHVQTNLLGGTLGLAHLDQQCSSGECVAA